MEQSKRFVVDVRRAGRPTRIGKEVDRIDEDDGASLFEDGPVVYSAQGHRTRGSN